MNTCEVCHNKKGNIPYTLREMMFGLRDKFEYFECNHCGCLQIQNIPEDMSPYYPKSYYSLSQETQSNINRFANQLLRWQISSLLKSKNLFQKLTLLFSIKNEFAIFQGLHITRSSKILDVGCGNGSNFLLPLAEMGFNNLLGCDPNLKDSISYSNKLKILKSDIREIRGTWDLICFHHSFEHIHNPVETLRQVYQLLAPNGICVLRIPTVSSFAWEHYRTNWVQLDAPRHFFLYSVKSLKILANKTNFELYKTKYDSGQFQFSGSEKYIKDIPLTASKWKDPNGFFKRKVKMVQYIWHAHKLNKSGRGDQAAFYFRKQNQPG